MSSDWSKDEQSELSDPKTTSFADSIAVTPVDGTENCFSIDIAKDWRAPLAMRSATFMVQGGHATSLIFSTVRKYFLTRYPSLSQPDPLNIHTQFIRTCPPTELRFVVTDLSIRPRFSVVQVEIWAPKIRSNEAAARSDGNDSERNEIELEKYIVAIVTQGNLAEEKGISLPSNSAIPVSEIPDRKTQCNQAKPLVPGVDLYMKLVGFAVHREGRIGLGEKPGEIIQEHWAGFGDGSGFDVLSLGLLCDLFWSTPHAAHPNRADLAFLRYPTLCLSIDIKKDPKGVKWLFRRCHSVKVANGRFDTVVYLVDELGDLYAFSKHVSLIIGKQKLNKTLKL